MPLSTISKISNNSYLKVSFGLPSSLSNHVIKLISQKQFEMVIEKRKLFTKRTHENQSGNSFYIEDVTKWSKTLDIKLSTL
jgi:hypothetical protein